MLGVVRRNNMCEAFQLTFNDHRKFGCSLCMNGWCTICIPWTQMQLADQIVRRNLNFSSSFHPQRSKELTELDIENPIHCLKYWDLNGKLHFCLATHVTCWLLVRQRYAVPIYFPPFFFILRGKRQHCQNRPLSSFIICLRCVMQPCTCYYRLGNLGFNEERMCQRRGRQTR